MQIIEGRQYFKVRPMANLRDMPDQCVRLYGPRAAFRFREQLNSEPQTRTYQEFQTDTEALGTALLELGFGGLRLAVIGENSYAWCVAHVSIVNGVGVAVPLDRLLPEDELLGLLDRGEVDVILYDASFQPVMRKAAQRLSRLRALVCLRPERLKDKEAGMVTWADPGAAGQPGQRMPSGPSFYRLPDLLAKGRQLLSDGNRAYRQVRIDPDALVSLLFTSGTTSAAKAVMLSHRNICADIHGLAGVVRLPAGIRLLSVLPLHHTFENTCGLFMALYVGGEIHECDGLRYIQKNMQEYGIDMLIGVPLLFTNFYNKVQDTLKKTGKDKLIKHLIPVTQALRHIGVDLRRLVYKQILAAFGGRFWIGICGAAPIDPEIIRFFDAIGVRILQGYGLTETAPVVAGCNSRLFVAGSVGQPLTGMSIAIDSETPGEPGEILVRGENVMLGYYQDAAATAEAIDRDGWLHTGDIGRLDPQTNCLNITGRVKSMIVLKTGKKIFPEEIEYLIGQADFIKESLVWGDKDPDGEVTISAKLVVDRDTMQQKTGQVVDDSTVGQYLAQLINDINSRLPSFKGIRQYVFSFQEMVKTTSLKIRRPIEIGMISDLMAKQKLKWRELTGRNLDQINADSLPRKNTLQSEPPSDGGSTHGT